MHYFMDNDRGLQLLCLLERLARLIGYHPRRIGLSATLGDCTSAVQWLNTDSGRDCIVPKCHEKGRSLRLSVRFFPIKEKIPNSDSKVLLQNYYDYLFESTWNKRCILFSNSKGEVEENIAHLRRIAAERRLPDNYLVHHANISPALREFTEQKMKSSEQPVCTGATVTLELGIDLGKLERIVQTGCPLTVSGLVQRLGRTGRRGGVAEMRFPVGYEPAAAGVLQGNKLGFRDVHCYDTALHPGTLDRADVPPEAPLQPAVPPDDELAVLAGER